jgi:iron-sulfur cluster assembly protein
MAQPSKLKIDISDNAVLKIQALVNQQGEQDQNGPEGKGLRVKVVGGGCSGLSYKMNLDAQRDGDRVFERENVKVLVDRKSFLYLRGTELDYSESLMDSGFKLNNPNVKRSCGCGSSFSV